MTPDSPRARRSVYEMLGEFFREAAVLVLVFGFLDRASDGRQTSLSHAFAIATISAGALTAGLLLELRAP